MHRAYVTALCVLLLTLACAPAVAQPDADPASLLAKRLSIAQRETKIMETRLEEALAEYRAVEPFLDEKARRHFEEHFLTRPDEKSFDVPTTPDEFLVALASYKSKIVDLHIQTESIRRFLEIQGFTPEELTYQKLVNEVAAKSASLRGLPLKHAIRSNVLGSGELSELLDRLLKAELTDERVRGETITWQAFRLLPEGTDLKLLYSDLLEEQVGGLYDDSSGKLYVTETFDPTSILGKIILSHEICHAIQDQNYPIKDLPFRTENTDQNLAVGAVLEGDATMLMVEWAAENFKMTDLLGIDDWFAQGTQQLESVPPPLVQSLIFPYMGGMYFYMDLKMRGIENWRNRPFAQPPLSTEQILHPEKYYPLQEKPVEVALPEWEAGDTGVEQIHTGIVGEWVTRLILSNPAAYPDLTQLTTTEVLVDDPAAVEGSAGWGGDRYLTAANEDNSRWVVTWKTVWDSEADAREFASAFERRVSMWDGLERLDAGENDFPEKQLLWLGESGGAAVFGNAKTVMVFLASDEALLRHAQSWARGKS